MVSLPVFFRPLTGTELPPFSQYLLPDTLEALRAATPGLIALGAVLGRSACGAAAAQVVDGRASLSSFFIDENARGQGTGGALLDQLCQQCAGAGARVLETGYALSGPDLAAMDALFLRRGAALSTRSTVYRVDSARAGQTPIKALFLPLLSSGRGDRPPL